MFFSRFFNTFFQMMDLKTAILNDLNVHLGPLHFECYPFKVDWYNAIVDTKFKLELHGDTLAVLVMNTPAMFEHVFLDDLFETYKSDEAKFESVNDPLDECLSRLFDKVKKVSIL